MPGVYRWVVWEGGLVGLGGRRGGQGAPNCNECRVRGRGQESITGSVVGICGMGTCQISRSRNSSSALSKRRPRPSSSSFMARTVAEFGAWTPDCRVSALNDRDDTVSGRSGAVRSGVRDTALQGDASSARLTASGSCAMMRRRVAAGPLTRRVPCSHFR